MQYTTIVPLAGLLAVASGYSQVMIDDFETTAQQVSTGGVTSDSQAAAVWGGTRTISISGFGGLVGADAGVAIGGAGLGDGVGYLANSVDGTADATFEYSGGPALNTSGFFQLNYLADPASVGAILRITLTDGAGSAFRELPIAIGLGSVTTGPLAVDFPGINAAAIKLEIIANDAVGAGTDVFISDFALVPPRVDVPEPGTYAMLAGLGLVAFAGYRRFQG